MEQCYVHRARQVLANVPTFGWHVDAVLYDPRHTPDIRAERFPSYEPMFKIKVEPSHKVPAWEQRFEPRAFHMTAERRWRVLNESAAGDEEPQRFFAKAIADNGGGILNCPGGTGKTVLVGMLREELQRRGPVTFLSMAMRHAAKALLPNGKTIAHALHRYAKLQPSEGRDVWCCLDEAGEIPLSLWNRIAQWKLVGWKFVVCGDFEGQLLPMRDRWRDVMEARDVATSAFMHGLVEGLACRLTTCRRCPDDRPHFLRVQALTKRSYARPGQPHDAPKFAHELYTALKTYQMLFPSPDAPPERVAVMSHKTRVLMNTLLNDRAAEEHSHKRRVEWRNGTLVGATMQPQSCYVWAGLEVMGSVRASKGKVVNGVHYVVTSLTDAGCTLKLHPDFKPSEDESEDDERVDGEAKMTWDEFLRTTRLVHALPYCYYQGKTVRDGVLGLMNTRSPHFTMRHLILGLGRVTNSRRAALCAPEVERLWLKMAQTAQETHGEGEA
jgi:hypothetical protein